MLLTVDRVKETKTDRFGFNSTRYYTTVNYGSEQLYNNIFSTSIVDDIENALEKLNLNLLKRDETVSLTIKVTGAELTEEAKAAIKAKFECEPSFSEVTFE